MRKIARPLLVLHSDALFVERLRTAARRQRWELRQVDGWDALLDQVRTAPASALLIVDPYAGVPDRRQPSVELAALMNRFPSLTVTAALAPGTGRLEHMRRLGEWGVVQIIDLEEDATPVGIADRLNAARGRPLRHLIEGSLPPSTSGPARSILSAATTVVSEGGQGVDLARALYVTPRTLLRWCRGAGLPPPRLVVAWVRILLASELLDDPGRTIADAALSCGYASDSTLRHALRNFVRMTPTELRERGAFQVVSKGFLEMLAEARSARKRYRALRGT